MILNDGQNDQVLATIASLRQYDVSPRHTDRLRSRCHARMRARPKSAPIGTVNGTLFRRVIGPALGGAWCLAYLFEVIRRAVAIYGF